MSKRRPSQSRRGAAAVELAFILPVLLILLVGIWEISRLVDAYQLLNNACREAGRQAAAGNMTAAEVQQVVVDYLEGANISTAGMPTPVIENLTDSSRTNPAEAEQLDHFRVTVSLPIANVEWSSLHFFTEATTMLGASVDWFSMRDEELVVSTTIPTL